MKHSVCLILFLLALATALAAEIAPADEERVEVLVPVGENLKAGGLAFRVSATEFQHNQVHFHVVIAGGVGHLPDATSLQARLGFDFWDHGRRIDRTREVVLKADGPSLVCDFSVHAGWLIDNDLCFVVTKLEAASVPLLSYYLYPGKFWDPDRALRYDYDALSVYPEDAEFLRLRTRRKRNHDRPEWRRKAGKAALEYDSRPLGALLHFHLSKQKMEVHRRCQSGGQPALGQEHAPWLARFHRRYRGIARPDISQLLPLGH